MTITIVDSGNYSEYNIQINKPLTIVGNNTGILSGYFYSFILNSSDVVIEGFSFNGKAIKSVNGIFINIIHNNF